jgi:hypothetical protein
VLNHSARRRAIAVLLLALGFCMPSIAQQATRTRPLAALSPLSIEQVRDAASLALPREDLKVDPKLLKVTRRPDLEDLLSTIVPPGARRSFYLYQVEMPTQASYDGQWTWIVAVAARKEGYELYSFESTEKRAEVAAEFNRFAAALSLSLSPFDLDNFATFFLEATVPFRPGEIVLDQDSLRDTVGRHYSTSYAEVWRSIDAYSRWWHGFLDADGVSELGPRTEVEPNGRYRVTLNRVVTTEGAHPQVQQWQLEISPGGNVQTASMRTIFPKSPRWIFYDSPGPPNAAPLQP